MKIHLIENDDVKECKREKYKSKLKLVTNDIDYMDTDYSDTNFCGVQEEEVPYTCLYNKRLVK